MLRADRSAVKQPRAMKGYLTVWHRWEDEITMPHGWCMARVPQHAGNTPIRWGSCARPDTQPPLGQPADLHQCALYEPIVSQEPEAYAPQNSTLMTDLESIQPDAESSRNQTQSANATAAASGAPLRLQLRESVSDDKAEEAEVSGRCAAEVLNRLLVRCICRSWLMVGQHCQVAPFAT